MAKIPISPEVLHWAMDESGSNPQALANVCDRSEETVTGWLTGADQPHRGDLAKLARHLGRPFYFFLRRSVPQEQRHATPRYRSALTDAKSASPREDAVLREADGIRKLARWLVQDSGVPFALPESSLRNAASFSAALATYLQWDFYDDQRKAASKTQVFKRLRESLERKGLIVLVKPLGPEGSRAFSLPDSITPVVVINASLENPSMKTFSLLHEIGHLAIGGSNLHQHLEETVEERWCDRMASEFLLPAHQLRTYMTKWRKLSFVRDDDLDTVRLVSNYFRSSWHASAISLRQNGFANQELVEYVAESFEPTDSGFVPGGQSRPEKRFNEFGSNFPSLLLESVSDGKVSDLDLRRYLRLTSEEEVTKISMLVA